MTDNWQMNDDFFSRNEIQIQIPWLDSLQMYSQLLHILDRILCNESYLVTYVWNQLSLMYWWWKGSLLLFNSILPLSNGFLYHSIEQWCCFKMVRGSRGWNMWWKMNGFLFVTLSQIIYFCKIIFTDFYRNLQNFFL